MQAGFAHYFLAFAAFARWRCFRRAPCFLCFSSCFFLRAFGVMSSPVCFSIFLVALTSAPCSGHSTQCMNGRSKANAFISISLVAHTQTHRQGQTCARLLHVKSHLAHPHWLDDSTNLSLHAWSHIVAMDSVCGPLPP